MQEGNMYVFINDGNDWRTKQEAYAFVFLKKIKHKEEMLNSKAFQEITYVCDLINARPEESEFKLFEAVDQQTLDDNKSALYTLIEI